MTQPPHAPGDDQQSAPDPQQSGQQSSGQHYPGDHYPGQHYPQPNPGQHLPSQHYPGQQYGNPYGAEPQPEQNQWITSSSQSAGRAEETQQVPPHGQPSAGQPQPYAGAYSQPGGYGASQPPTAPHGSSFGSWQPQQSQPERRIRDANPLRAAFDFSFKSYATPGIAKIVYIVAIVLGVVWWIGGAIYWFVLGAVVRQAAQALSGPFGGSGSGGGGAFTVVGILSLVLGWIPVALWVLVVRVFLEAAVAMIRTAGDARTIRTKLEE